MSRPLNLTDLPPDLARFAEARIADGRFASVEDVLRACMDALERQQRNEQKTATLRTAIDEGDASPDAPPGVLERVRAGFSQKEGA